ncbi:hypothetical protein PP246_gp26 [Streptococcus phage P9851]|uniref:Uncharacterized protein n=1 Tax=Streptococcus phage P9851 TaxID=1971443 RepID=A0A286QT37_9CAUD|nr:hypothetical protein PP246_gp26 [Streptococcus phage P9851]ARU14534.1 hypothetical protein P9851_26 [Streptococcus phage P9851]
MYPLFSPRFSYLIYLFFYSIITQKKPQHNAEASTTTAMVSLLQCEVR